VGDWGERETWKTRAKGKLGKRQKEETGRKNAREEDLGERETAENGKKVKRQKEETGTKGKCLTWTGAVAGFRGRRRSALQSAGSDTLTTVPRSSSPSLATLLH
jgi:hypothetical protein